MTYALKVSDAARASLVPLPFDLQEAVWDLLDRIVSDPGEPDRRARLDATAHWLIHRVAGGADTGVELVIGVDHDAQMVYLLAVTLAQ